MKKGLLVLLIAIIAVGGVFAQEEEEEINNNRQDFSSMPKNVVSIDLGPLYIGAVYWFAGQQIASDTQGLSFHSFGIAAQYERQLSPKLSLGGRFAYLWMGASLTMTIDFEPITAKVDFSTMSIEGHVRYYPGGRVFFIGGILGYGNMIYKGTASDSSLEIEVINVLTNYFKFGPRVGWRIDFGKPGGFILETSIGFDAAIRIGASSISQMQNLGGDIGEDMSLELIETYYFVGGPRLTFSLGWRF